MKAKGTKYGGTYRPTLKLIPLAFSTYGAYSSSLQELVKELGENKAEMTEDYPEASDIARLGIQAPETDRLHRRLSIVPQNALAHRTLRDPRRLSLYYSHPTGTLHQAASPMSQSPALPTETFPPDTLRGATAKWEYRRQYTRISNRTYSFGTVLRRH